MNLRAFLDDDRRTAGNRPSFVNVFFLAEC